MAVLTWDDTGKKIYETGVNKGVLYIPDSTGAYTTGVAWNGLVGVTETPSGADANPSYADNIKYMNLLSAETFGGTIQAFTYPKEFAQCDGTLAVKPGVWAGQQPRKSFGMCYRTIIGNDVSPTAGYKLHLLYGLLAAPAERAYQTINDSPAAITFSWTISSTPINVTGFAPTSILTIDSTQVAAADLTALEGKLYGGASTQPTLPTPDAVAALFVTPVP